MIWTNTLAFGTSVILNDLHALGLRDQFVVGSDNWGMDLATYAFLADPAYGVGLISPFPYLWWTDVDNPGVQYAQQLFEANERGAGEHNVGYLLLVGGVDMIVQAVTEAIDTVGGPYWYFNGVNITAALAWAAGFVTFEIIALMKYAVGGSIPSMLVAGLIYYFITRGKG